MPVEMGGVSFVQPTQELMDHLEQHVPLKDITAPLTPFNLNPTINYKHYLDPKDLFALRWPSGATRWGCMWGLMTGTQFSTLMSSLGTAAAGVNLVMNDGTQAGSAGDLVFQNMFVATASVLMTEALDIEIVDDLVLVNVVDQRYWWQFLNMGAYTVEEGATWDELISKIGTEIGNTIQLSPTTIDTEWLVPDIRKTERDSGRIVDLLDGIAHSIGRRVVMYPDGRVILEDFEAAEDVLWNANAAGYDQFSAAARSGKVIHLSDTSDPYRLQVPAKVEVRFPDPPIQAPQSEYTVKEVEGNTGPLSGYLLLENTVKTYTAGGDNTDQERQSYADGVGLAFYDSQKYKYDLIVNGLWPWTPCAYDWLVTWYIQGMVPGGGSASCGTRSQTEPMNLEVRELLNKTLPIDSSGIIRWEITVSWEDGSLTDQAANGAPVELVFDDMGALVNGDPIQLHDTLPMFEPLPAGTRGYATRLPDTPSAGEGNPTRYEVIQAQCLECDTEPEGPVEP